MKNVSCVQMPKFWFSEWAGSQGMDFANEVSRKDVTLSGVGGRQNYNGNFMIDKAFIAKYVLDDSILIAYE